MIGRTASRCNRFLRPQQFVRYATTHVNSGASFLANVPQGPPDPILGIVEAFKADKDPKKLNFSVGAYRDDDGNPVVLNSVREAERRVVDQNLNMEYAPIGGPPGFVAP